MHGHKMSRDGPWDNIVGHDTNEGREVPTHIGPFGAPCRHLCDLTSCGRATLSSAFHAPGQAGPPLQLCRPFTVHLGVKIQGVR